MKRISLTLLLTLVLAGGGFGIYRLWVSGAFLPETPLEAGEHFFEAYSAADSAVAGSYLSGLGYTLQYNEITEKLAENTSVILGNQKIDRKNARVEATVRSVDLVELIRKVPDTVSSKEEAREELLKLLEEDPETVEFQTELTFVREYGEWRLVMTADLMDALWGGLYSGIEEAQALMEEEE